MQKTAEKVDDRIKMKLILTSHIGGMTKENGIRIPAPLFWYNGFVEQLKQDWPEDARILIVVAGPDDYEKNDSVCECLKQSFPMSGLGYSSIEICDDRNPEIVNRINEMTMVLLAGGHVPTQNKFFESIGLRDKLKNYDGLIVGLSAGSMNCADNVYAGPELEGEAIDPYYQRWIKGLGLTDINIYPHFQSIRDEWLDGMRLIEDITFADSIGHEFIAINDGSYIVVCDGQSTLYGEGYRIKDGTIEKICDHGESVRIK